MVGYLDVQVGLQLGYNSMTRQDEVFDPWLGTRHLVVHIQRRRWRCLEGFIVRCCVLGAPLRAQPSYSRRKSPACRCSGAFRWARAPSHRDALIPPLLNLQTAAESQPRQVLCESVLRTTKVFGFWQRLGGRTTKMTRPTSGSGRDKNVARTRLTRGRKLTLEMHHAACHKASLT